jgi:peptidoglycan/xylan/chitin deacetylase (PgdA/CDA1 family)
MSQVPISIKFLKYFLSSSVVHSQSAVVSPIILCYHNISDNPTDPFTVSSKDFSDQIYYLKRNFQIVSLSDFLKSKNALTPGVKEAPTPGVDRSVRFSSKPHTPFPISHSTSLLSKFYKSSFLNHKSLVSITFDDGYNNVLNIVYPILKKANIMPCIFLNSPDLNDRLSVKDIQKLHSEGWEFGWHTKEHIDLKNALTPGVKEAPTPGVDRSVHFLNNKKRKHTKCEGSPTLGVNSAMRFLFNQLIEEKRQIEKLLGFELPYFSYPFNKYSSEVIQNVKKAGYNAAFTANGGYANLTNPHMIDRIIIPNYLTIKEFQSLLTPGGISLNQKITQFLKNKDRFLPNLKVRP